MGQFCKKLFTATPPDQLAIQMTGSPRGVGGRFSDLQNDPAPTGAHPGHRGPSDGRAMGLPGPWCPWRMGRVRGALPLP